MTGKYDEAIIGGGIAGLCAGLTIMDSGNSFSASGYSKQMSSFKTQQ